MVGEIGQPTVAGDAENADAVFGRARSVQIGDGADPGGRRVADAGQQHRRVVGDVGDVGQRAVGADPENADAVVRLAGDEQIGVAVDHRGRKAARAV